MNNNKLESKELYERIREYDEVISVPNSVRYSELNAYKSGIADIVKQVDELNSLPSNPKEKNIIRMHRKCCPFSHGSYHDARYDVYLRNPRSRDFLYSRVADEPEDQRSTRRNEPFGPRAPKPSIRKRRLPLG